MHGGPMWTLPFTRPAKDGLYTLFARILLKSIISYPSRKEL
jgi:hypothetical protein